MKGLQLKNKEKEINYFISFLVLNNTILIFNYNTTYYYNYNYNLLFFHLLGIYFLISFSEKLIYFKSKYPPLIFITKTIVFEAKN